MVTININSINIDNCIINFSCNEKEMIKDSIKKPAISNTNKESTPPSTVDK